MAPSRWWFSAWTLPHDPGGFEAKVDQLPVQDWSFEENDDRARSTIKLAVPRAHPDLDINSVFKVDPASHANDVGSMVLAYTSDKVDGANKPLPVAAYFLARRPDETTDVQESLVEFSGRHPITALDFVTVYPWDYPRSPSLEMDWIYGAENILTNPGFEDGSPQSEQWSVFLTNTTTGQFSLDLAGETTAPIDWDATTTEIKDAIELGISVIISVSVSGEGTEENPWIITVTDPSGEDFQDLAGNVGTIDGEIHIATDVQGGFPDINGWTRSMNLSRGDIAHGRYASNGFRLTTAGEPVRSGNYALRVNGLSIYVGAMQVVKVNPGTRYRASIWIYTTNGSDMFRLIIRDRFERFIASSHGLSGRTIPVATWTEFTVDFVVPDDIDTIIFRAAVIGTGGVAGQEGNPDPFFLDDAFLAPGEPPANAGKIWNHLMDDCQVDHLTDARGTFLTWVNRTWDETVDSRGNAWTIEHSITIREGQTYLQLAEQFFDQWGYDFDLRLDPTDNEFYMDVFQRGSAGNNYSADDAISLVIGKDIVQGEIVKSEPAGTDVFARGAAGLFAEIGDATLLAAWERREKYVKSNEVTAQSDLNQMAQSTLNDFLAAMIGMKFDMMDRDDGDVKAFVHFVSRDFINVEPGSDSGIAKNTHEVRAIKVDGKGGQATNVSVHIASEVFGSTGWAAQAEAVRRLVRKFRYTFPPFDPTGAVDLGLGGGGIPDVVVAPANTTFFDTADLFCPGSGDQIKLDEAFELLPENGPGWIHILSGDVHVDAATFISRAGEVKITGAGQGVTTIHLENSFNDEAVFWHGGTVDTPNTVTVMTVEDISIDGNKAGGAVPLRGLLASSLGSTIPYYLNRVELYNSAAAGLGSDVASVARSANTWYITNCHFHDNDGSGAGIMGSSSFITASRIMNNGGAGINADFGGTHVVIGSEIAFNGGHGMDGESLTGRASFIVTGSNIHDNVGGGIINGGLSDPIVVVGNSITNNGGQSAFGVVGSIITANYINGNGTDEPFPNAGVTPQVITFSAAIELFVTAGTLKFVSPRSGTLLGVQAAVGVSPTGAAVITDVHKNGVTVFTTQANRPTIADGASVSATTVPDIVDISIGDVFTVDIDQVGSTTPGNDLTVMLDLVWD